MKHYEFHVIDDEDGIVIYDESDDYFPGDGRIFDGTDELDMDYILEYEKQQEARKAAELRHQRWISAGVIACVILYIALVTYIAF
ncbi:MAG: hypothetical protein K2K68_00395 [Duncaniella sp.]|nr:hypothetical protein [Duncaniella sp.]